MAPRSTEGGGRGREGGGRGRKGGGGGGKIGKRENDESILG